MEEGRSLPPNSPSNRVSSSVINRVIPPPPSTPPPPELFVGRNTQGSLSSYSPRLPPPPLSNQLFPAPLPTNLPPPILTMPSGAKGDSIAGSKHISNMGAGPFVGDRFSTHEKKVSQVNIEQAIIHYNTLKGYLAERLKKTGGQVSSQRASAREKLTRLTKQQFHELSTDVYDETNRRQNTSGVDIPFLPVNDNFHPKRNQARQKLATLPDGRFKDLASDVFAELERRYPSVSDAASINSGLPNSMAAPQTNTSSVVAPSQSIAPGAPLSGIFNVNSNVVAQPTPTSTVFTPEESKFERSGSNASAHGPPPGPPPTASLPRPPTPVGGSPIAAEDRSRSNSLRSNQGSSGSHTPTTPRGPAPPPPANITPAVAANASTKPSGGVVSVNYSSLDTLMADLGNMIGTTPGGQGTTSTAAVSSGAAADPPLGVSATALAFKELQEREKLLLKKLEEKDAEIRAHKEELDAVLAKMESENESRLSMSRKRIAQLEDELARKGSISDNSLTKLRDLEAQLADEHSKNDRLVQELAKMESLSADRLRMIQSLEDQLANEERNFNEKMEIQSREIEEVERLRGELEALRSRVKLLEMEKEQDKLRIRGLMEEKNKVELDLSELKVENLSLKEELLSMQESSSTSSGVQDALDSTTGYDDSFPTDITHSLYAADSSGDVEPFTILDQSKVSTYRLAVDHLVRTLRSDDANALPPVVWSIVNAARSIAEDAETYDEKYRRLLPPSESEKLTSLRGKVSVQLTELISAVKNHARIVVGGNEGGTKNIGAEITKVETSVAALTSTVLELVKMLQSAPSPSQPPSVQALASGGVAGRGRMGSLANTLSPTGSPRPKAPPTVQSNNPYVSSTPANGSVDSESLKVFLEGQTDKIVVAIQLLLACIKDPQAHADSIRQHLTDITSSVEHFVGHTRSVLDRPSRTNMISGSKRNNTASLLRELSNANTKLKEIEEQSRTIPNIRPSKQKVASCAYEVARFTKEICELLGM